MQFLVSKKTLAQWGYSSKEFKKIKQHAWEKEMFGHANIYKQKIRAKKPVKGERGLYFRFTLLQETYSSVKAAQNRSTKIRKVPESLNTKMHPEYILRDGFQHKNKVYIVTTDALFMQMHKNGLPKIIKLFKSYIEKK